MSLYSTGTYHVVSWKQFLQELCLFVLDGFDDEFIITGQVEERAAGARIRQLNQGLFTNGILQDYNKNNQLKQNIMSLYVEHNRMGPEVKLQLQLQSNLKNKKRRK